jgi:hypothetical protein
MFPEFRKWKMELTVIGNFHLLVANGKRKQQISAGLLQMGTENGNLFSWSTNNT